MIQIKDTNAVKKEAQILITEANKLKNIKETIESILSELNEYWNSSQEDQQAFYSELLNDTRRLQFIYEDNVEFSNAITDYMDITEKTSNTKI